MPLQIQPFDSFVWVYFVIGFPFLCIDSDHSIQMKNKIRKLEHKQNAKHPAIVIPRWTILKYLLFGNEQVFAMENECLTIKQIIKIHENDLTQ